MVGPLQTDNRGHGNIPLVVGESKALNLGIGAGLPKTARKGVLVA